MGRELGRRIRAARLRLGLTQQEVAEGIVSAAFLSMVESGRREPSDEVLALLSQRLGLDPTLADDGQGARQLTHIRSGLAAAALALDAGDFAAALQACELASPLLAGLDEPDLLTDLLHASGRARAGLGQLDSAVRDLVAAAEQAAARGATDREVAITVDLARCLGERGDLSAAHDRAAALLKRLPPELEGTALHSQLVSILIGLHLTRGDQTMAHLLADRARAAFEAAPDPQAKALVLWNASLAAEANGDPGAALLLVQEARRLMAARIEGALLGRLHVAIAWLHTRVSPPDLDAAERDLAMARDCFGPDAAPVDQALLRSEASRLRWLRGDFAGALAEARASVELFGAAPQSVAAASAHLLAARAAASLGDLPDSRQHVQAAQRVLAAAEASRAASLGWRELGDAYLALGFMEDALLAYRQALTDAGLAETPIDTTVDLGSLPVDR